MKEPESRSKIDPGGNAKEDEGGGGDAFAPLLCNIERIMMLYHKQEVAGGIRAGISQLK